MRKIKGGSLTRLSRLVTLQIQIEKLMSLMHSSVQNFLLITPNKNLHKCPTTPPALTRWEDAVTRSRRNPSTVEGP